jgi:WD40 repeat protein
MNVASPKLIWQLTFEGAWPSAVAFLGSGRRLAAANQDGQIYIWDLPAEPPEAKQADEKSSNKNERKAPNAAPVRRLDGHTNAVSSLVATRDGEQLISASYDHSIRIWETNCPVIGTAEVILDSETRKSAAKRNRQDDKTSAPGVHVETNSAAQILTGHTDWVRTLSLSNDQRRLISGDGASQVIVWDLGERREIAHWSGQPWNWIVAAALSPDGQSALVSEFRYKRDDFDIPAAAVRVFQADSGKQTLDILKTQFPKFTPDATTYSSAQVWRKFVADGLIAADYSPDGKIIALGQGGETDTGKVHLLDSATGKLLRDVSGHQYGVTAVRFSADGKYLLSTGRDTMLRICQVADGKEVAALGTPRGGQFKDWLSALAISPDQKLLAATDIAGLVHVWSLE